MCQQKLKLLVLLLVLLFLPLSSLVSIPLEVLESNLTLSQNLIARLQNQYQLLVQDLDSKNLQLQNLQNNNQLLTSQLTDLQTQFNSQTVQLNNLSMLNKTLTEQQEVLEQQSLSYQTQFQSLSKELEQKGFNSSMNILWGVLGGLVVGVVGTWAVMTFTK